MASEDVDLAAKAPEEATMDDEDLFGPVKKGKKKGGQQQQQKAEEPEADDAGDDDAGGGRVKSKKEKEKEKKEREKQRKKEQAAKKKTTGPVPQKQDAPKTAPESTPEAAPAAAAPAAPESAATGGKKKKLNPALLALQKQQEERRKREEEEARRIAEEKARIEEEERLAAEEEKRKEEAKQAKKLKEKQKIEQLKKEGKYLTKAQKEAQAKAQQRMQQMLQSGAAKVEGLNEGEAKKKPVYENKKKKGHKQTQEATAAEAKAEEARKKLEELKLAEEEAAKAAEAEAAAKAEAEAKAKEAEESDELDDWEAQADAEDGVKESWDMSSDEEEENPTSKKAAPAKAAANKAGANGKAPEKPSDAKQGQKAKTPAKAPTKASSKAVVEDSDSESEDDSSSEDEEATATQRALAVRKAEAAARKKKQHEEALAARSEQDLRSPICCILGHVDTGKTKLLDKIRQTNVQEGEAGGITQQIGATYFPVEALRKKTAVVNKDGKFEFKVPGLLVIDTPGHESFTNLRSRGSSLCNMAILVVDIMHGLEPQTIESLNLLKARKTPFIIALNKIDRLYNWSRIADNGFQDSLSLQKKGTQQEFKDRLNQVKVAIAEQGLNSELFYENKNMSKNVSIVPTSAHTGEGIPDLLKLLVTLTQERLTSRLMYLSEVECTVLEVKVVEGLGTTIDVVLTNGILHEGDRIVICGDGEAIATNIRALLTPAEMKELRIKSAYVHNKEVKAAMGIKIAADGLEGAIAGSRLLVVGEHDDEEDLKDEVMQDLSDIFKNVSTSGRGVSVQASTLGSLEALLEFLRVSKIPVATIAIGPVYKKHVFTTGVMLEKAKEYAVMLCFDVKIDKEAEQYADEIGVKIFRADIIYHLFDQFTAHMKQLEEQRKEESKELAVFPCVLNTVAVFNKKDPIVIGVDVIEGSLRLSTPIAAVKKNPVTGTKEIINLGRVTSIERDHKQVPVCKRGQPSVAVKIEGSNQPMYGRHLEEADVLYSAISRKSIDVLKEFFRSDVTTDEWLLIKKLKPTFDIP